MAGPSARTAELAELRFAGMRWLVVRGPRDSCFRTLGSYAKDSIRYVVEDFSKLRSDFKLRSGLTRASLSETGKSRFDAVVNATATRFPGQLGELEALAAGAGVPFDSLVMLNLRGVLGKLGAVGGGCSDIAVRGDHLILAHNEDEDVAHLGRLDLLTLHVDGDPPLWVLWYPGMLPCDAFTITQNLAWGLDSIPVKEPIAAPGGNFVNRALQRVENLDEAVDFLRSEPCAGGFACTMAEASSGRVVTVETAAGQTAVVEADAARLPVLWHTNHARYLPATGRLSESSVRRAEALARAVEGSSSTMTEGDRMFEMLTKPLPEGVRQDGAVETLCTVVADLTMGEVLLAPGRWLSEAGQRERAKINDLLTGAKLSTEPAG